jgi:hypothetical protein
LYQFFHGEHFIACPKKATTISYATSSNQRKKEEGRNDTLRTFTNIERERERERVNAQSQETKQNRAFQSKKQETKQNQVIQSKTWKKRMTDPSLRACALR